MTEVRYLPRARSDVLGAVEFYESRAVGLGAEFLTTLEHVINGILASPHAGSPYESGTRRVVLGRFPFSVVYEFTEERLLVVAIAHHRRKPGYWSNDLAHP